MKTLASIDYSKGEYFIRIQFIGRQRDNIGHVDDRGQVTWDDPERVPFKIRAQHAPKLAQEIIRRRQHTT